MKRAKTDPKDRLIRDMLKSLDYCAESSMARIAARQWMPAFIRRTKRLKIQLPKLEYFL